MLRVVFLTADAVCILAFLAGYTARFVHPRHLWWLQLVAVGLPYISMIVVAATICVMLGGARKLLFLHLVLCLLIVLRFAAAVRFGKSETVGSEPASLGVITYNVWPKYPQGENWDAVNELLQTEEPDLAALPEMPTWFSAVEFMYAPDEVPEHTEYRTAKLEVPPDCRSSQVILSRLPLAKQKPVRLKHDSDGCTDAVRARAEWDGREFAIYAVHLRSFERKPWSDSEGLTWDAGSWLTWFRTLKNDFLARAREADRIARMVREENVPVILCGDFNTTPHNWEYRRITRELSDAFRAASWKWGATYFARTGIAKIPLARIDFIFVSKEWRVISAKVPEVGLSDHLPVLARLQLTS